MICFFPVAEMRVQALIGSTTSHVSSRPRAVGQPCNLYDRFRPLRVFATVCFPALLFDANGRL